MQHALHVCNRTFAIASTKHDRYPVLHVIPDGEQVIFGINTDDVADQVITRIAAFYRKAGEDISGRPINVSRENLADIFLENIQSRTIVNADGHVVIRFGQGMDGTDGAAALA